jgi:hypothetical protein
MRICLGVALTLALALLAFKGAYPGVTAKRQGPVTDGAAPTSMELLYLSPQGEWRIKDAGEITFTDMRGGVLQTKLPVGIVDAVMAGASALAVLSPDGVHWLEVGEGDLRLTPLCQLDPSGLWTRIIAANVARQVWIQGRDGISLVEKGAIGASSPVRELVVGLGLWESSIGRGYLPILEADNLSGTAYIILRVSRGGSRILVFDPASRTWCPAGNVSDAVAAPVVVNKGSLLLLDGSERRFSLPNGATLSGPTDSCRNRFAEDRYGHYIATVWRPNLDGGATSLLQMDSQSGRVANVLSADMKSNTCVHCNHDGCVGWLSGWWGRQVPVRVWMQGRQGAGAR